MSEPGDVVWADGQAWIRGTTAYGDHKAWWCHPLPVSGEVYRRLSEAEQADDFMWLVKDGIPIVLNALAVYQALDSFADFVAKRDADAELTAERDELLSRLAEMTAQRDAARKDAQEAVAEHKKLVDHYAADFPRRAADNKELRELRQTCSDLGKENEQLSAALNDEKRIGRQEERESIVTWLSSQYRTANGSFTHAIAEEIRNGKHLAGDDV